MWHLHCLQIIIFAASLFTCIHNFTFCLSTYFNFIVVSSLFYPFDQRCSVDTPSSQYFKVYLKCRHFIDNVSESYPLNVRVQSLCSSFWPCTNGWVHASSRKKCRWRELTNINDRVTVFTSAVWWTRCDGSVTHTTLSDFICFFAKLDNPRLSWTETHAPMSSNAARSCVWRLAWCICAGFTTSCYCWLGTVGH